MNPAPSSGTWKLFTRSTRVTSPVLRVHDAHRVLRHLFRLLLFLLCFFGFRFGGLNLEHEEASVGGEEWLCRRRARQVRANRGSASGDLVRRIDRLRASRVSPFGSGCEVANDHFTITILRHQRIGDELSVARKRLSLNRAPAVVVAVSQRALDRRLLRANAIETNNARDE